MLTFCLTQHGSVSGKAIYECRPQQAFDESLGHPETKLVELTGLQRQQSILFGSKLKIDLSEIRHGPKV